MTFATTTSTRRFMAAVALTVVAVLATTPTPAGADSPSPAACGVLYRGNPRGSLHVTTDPPAGSILRAGATVWVTATWNTADWSAAELHKVLDCLLVDGQVAYDLSHQEKPTANDGRFTYQFTVPVGARGICDRVRLSARPHRGADLVVQKRATSSVSRSATTRRIRDPSPRRPRPPSRWCRPCPSPRTV